VCVIVIPSMRRGAFRRTGEGFLEGRCCGVEFVKGDQRLAGIFFECHRGHCALIALFVRPDDALVWRHFFVRAEERHRLVEGRMAEHEAIPAPGAHIHVA